MKRFTVSVSCMLKRTYETEVEAEDLEMAFIAAEKEIYTEIDPNDIDVLAVEAKEIE